MVFSYPGHSPTPGATLPTVQPVPPHPQAPPQLPPAFAPALAPQAPPAPPPAPAREPWDWDPGLDSAQTWSAFQYFLNYPPPRKISAIAAAFQQAETTVRGWSYRGQWVRRALAFDKYNGELLLQRTQNGVAELAGQFKTRQLELLSLQTAILENETAKLHRDSFSSQTTVLSAREVRQFSETAITKARLILGQTTENPGMGVDLSKLNAEQLAQFEALLNLCKRDQ